MAKKTANDAYFDASVRHQVRLRQYGRGEARRILKILEEADRELVAKLRERLARLGQSTDFTSRRFKLMLEDIRTARDEVMARVGKEAARGLSDLAKSEAETEGRIIKASIPIQVELAAVDLRSVASTVMSRPFNGHLLKDWFEGLRVADQRGLQRSIQLGMTQGESIPQIMTRVAGSRERMFGDGTLAETRRKTEAVVRTAVNHVSNEARSEMWSGNEDIIAALRWTSTLDGRTSPICRARDGQLAPVGGKSLPEGAVALDPPGARPPAHINCRSIMVAVIDGEGLVGSRPFVRSADRPQDREADFRAQAREEGRSLKAVRDEWADANIGQMPSATTYQEWLTRQPAGFQDEVLGAARGKLFRDGKATLDQFVESSGRELTLEELAKRGVE